MNPKHLLTIVCILMITTGIFSISFGAYYGITAPVCLLMGFGLMMFVGGAGILIVRWMSRRDRERYRSVL